MNRVIRCIQAGLFLVVLGGCANTSLTSDVDPSADLSTLQSFYVSRLPADERGIEKMIEAELNAIGKHAFSGSDPKSPSPVDAVVTYEDKWMWDITMYMLELEIDLRDPDTNYEFATGRSFRTSLARKSPEEMVREVLSKIFAGQLAGDTE